MEYINTDDQTRTWSAISLPNGSTLELEPKEKIELDLDKTFDDPYLKVVRPRKETSKIPTKTPPDVPADPKE